MYYEPYKRKSRGGGERRRRIGCLGMLFRLILRLLLVILIVAVALYALPASLFNVEPKVDLSINAGLPSGVVNVLILGVDKISDGHQRSDGVLIASVSYNKLRLTSILRDTVVNIPGHGSGKINAAYAHGGAELAMKTVNANFSLNISKYIVVDFVTLVKLVDALGGVDISISEAEMKHINWNVANTAKIFIPLGYTAKELFVHGENTHLTGLQALGYARIRKIDSDFQRTNRQRTLIVAMMKKLVRNAWNPIMLFNFAKALFTAMDTNISIPQMLSLGLKVLPAGNIEQLRLPVDGSYNDDGSSIRIDNKANIEAFTAFVYR